MKVITAEQLRAERKSNTIVIFGCGYSINSITEEEWKKIGKFDSIAFNEFYKGSIPTTFYLVRENNVIPSRCAPGEQLDDFYRAMNGPYKDSVKIVCTLWYRENHYRHEDNLDKILGKGVVVRDIQGKPSFGSDIFHYGICHGKCTLFNCVHFAIWMKYERILFVGVDLYDSRYFWLHPDQPRYTLRSKRATVDTTHSTAEGVLRMVRKIGQNHGVMSYVHNPKSLLTKVIKVWDRK